MRNKEKISVILPVYNAEKYLPQCMQSLLSQTYENFEIIAIDDGSKDDSAAILQQYVSEDSRVKLFQNDVNRGLIHVLNHAVSKCAGKLIARMDADDWCEPHRLQTQYDYLISHPQVDMVGCWIQLFGDKSEVWHYRQHDAFIKALLLFRTNGMPHNGLLAYRQVFERFQYDPAYPHLEDVDMWMRMMCSVSPVTFANVPEVLVHYRTYPEQVSETFKAVQYNLYDQCIQRLLKSILQRELTIAEWNAHKCLMYAQPAHVDIDEVYHWYCTLHRAYCEKFDDDFFVISEKWLKYYQKQAKHSEDVKRKLLCDERFCFIY